MTNSQYAVRLDPLEGEVKGCGGDKPCTRRDTHEERGIRKSQGG